MRGGDHAQHLTKAALPRSTFARAEPQPYACLLVLRFDKHSAASAGPTLAMLLGLKHAHTFSQSCPQRLHPLVPS